MLMNGKNNNAPHISYVSDKDKELIWQDVLAHFTLQTDDYHEDITHERLMERVRHWTMKKMATQFQSWKKQLYKSYVKKNKTANWNDKGLIAKARPYWEEFV